jgi:hypothetical protein
MQSVAISGDQRQSAAISGNQWQSVAISGNQWQSVAISGDQWQSVKHLGERRIEWEFDHLAPKRRERARVVDGREEPKLVHRIE